MDAIPSWEELLDQRAVARMINATEKFLEARRHRGGGPVFCKIGSLVRYRRSDVMDWIEAQRRTSTSGDGRVAP